MGVAGVAVRQDGRSASLTAPNGSAQRALLGAALASAGVTAAGMSRLEAHGTGTALGDPTEAGSLAAALCGFGSGRSSPLAVGAAKASVGHSEAASGQVGLQRLSSALAATDALDGLLHACCEHFDARVAATVRHFALTLATQSQREAIARAAKGCRTVEARSRGLIWISPQSLSRCVQTLKRVFI